jgi:signal transduction histidine kinase
MPLHEILRRQPRWIVILEATVLAGLIGWVDYVTPWEWTFFVFYSVPIILVTWRVGRRFGFGFAILSTIIWSLAIIESNPYRTSVGFAIAVFSQGFYFVVLVIAVSAVVERRALDRARIASLERAQDLEREILRTSEKEQQRIGRDLHDSLGPQLAAIGYAVSFLENELRQRGQPEVATTGKIRDMVREAMSLTRGLARGIFPVQMDASGLATALTELADTMSRVSGTSVSFCETGNTSIDDPEVGMHLFRIAQEAVNNAAKHGEARNVSVSLSSTGGFTRLIIADDGKGISRLPTDRKGIGLESMRYRARALRGEFKIDSIPGEGTVVVCELRDRVTLPATAAL